MVKDKNKYYSHAAGDIFKLLGPASEQVAMRKVDSLTIRMLEAAREILRYYARRVKAILLDPVCNSREKVEIFAADRTFDLRHK